MLFYRIVKQFSAKMLGCKIGEKQEQKGKKVFPLNSSSHEEEVLAIIGTIEL